MENHWKEKCPSNLSKIHGMYLNFKNQLKIFISFPEFFQSTKLPNYLILFLGSGSSGYLTVFGISGVDGLFIGLCFHISGQFQIIKSWLNGLMSE